MPFPLAALAPIVAAAGSAIATAAGAAVAVGAAAATAAVAAAPFVAAGAAVLGGIAITKAIIEENERAREEARRRTEAMSSREEEKKIVNRCNDFFDHVKRLEEKYGSNLSEEPKKEMLKRSSILLGELEGNANSWKKKGMSPSEDAERTQAALVALREKIAPELGGKNHEHSQAPMKEQEKSADEINDAHSELDKLMNDCGLGK